MKKLIVCLAVILLLSPAFFGELVVAQPSSELCSDTSSLLIENTIPADGAYSVWFRMKKESVASRPFVKVLSSCDEIKLPAGDDWEWVSGLNETLRYSLSQGVEPVRLSVVGGNVLVDKILVTTSTTCTPIADGKNCIEERLDFHIGGISQGSVAGQVNIRAEQVSQIDGTAYSFKIDGEEAAVATEEPYCFFKLADGTCSSVNIEEYGKGEHTLEVTARTPGGQQMAKSVPFTIVAASNVPPVTQPITDGPNAQALQPIPLSITGVRENEILTSDVEIRAELPTGFAGVVGVKFSIDNGSVVTRSAPPFCLVLNENGACKGLSLSSLSNGSHQIIVTANATGYSETKITIPFSVINPIAASTNKPQVIVSKDLQKVTGTARVGIPEKNISQGSTITYKVEDKTVGEGTAASPTVNLNTSSVGNGPKKFVAEIKDINGQKTVLESTVEVNNGLWSRFVAMIRNNKAGFITTLFMLAIAVTGLIVYVSYRRRRQFELAQHANDGFDSYNYIMPYEQAQQQMLVKQGALAVVVLFIGVGFIYKTGSVQAAPGFGYIGDVAFDATYIPSNFEHYDDMMGIVAIRMVATDSTTNPDTNPTTPDSGTGGQPNPTTPTTPPAVPPSPTPNPNPITPTSPPVQPTPSAPLPSGMSRHLGMGPLINNSLIPGSIAGVGSPMIVTGAEAGRKAEGDGEGGAFRHRCVYSHMNYDDPILFLNQPNAAHLHTFFGNTATNAYSTPTSLKNSGNSTCSGGTFNRSAYWIPTMIDESGVPQAPKDTRNCCTSDIEIYYKLGYQGVMREEIRGFPNGLEIIAGNPSNATSITPNDGVNGPNKDNASYWCEDPVHNGNRYQEGSTIPDCPPGQLMTMLVAFPQCWDGVNLKSANGRSHMAYGSYRANINEPGGCPASHPVGLPFIEFFVRWTITDPNGTGGWRLSSDNYDNGPGGYSGHADYIFAWDESAFPAIEQYCYRDYRDCGYSLGDGRLPKPVRNYDGNLIDRENYPF